EEERMSGRLGFDTRLILGIRTHRPRLAALSILLLVLIAFTTPGHAAAKSAEYSRFDVAVELRPDGTYHVTETQQVSFSDAPFSLGPREIPLARTDGIGNVKVSSVDEAHRRQPLTETDLTGLADGPNRFNVRTTSTDVRILWTFEPVTYGTRTFVL